VTGLNVAAPAHNDPRDALVHFRRKVLHTDGATPRRWYCGGCWPSPRGTGPAEALGRGEDRWWGGSETFGVGLPLRRSGGVAHAAPLPGRPPSHMGMGVRGMNGIARGLDHHIAKKNSKRFLNLFV